MIVNYSGEMVGFDLEACLNWRKKISVAQAQRTLLTMYAGHELLLSVCGGKWVESEEIPGATQMSEAVLVFFLQIWKNCVATTMESQSY